MSENEYLDQDEYYSDGDRIGNYLSKTRNEEVLQNVKGRLLDLGCGDGQLIKGYKGDSTGVDIKDYGAADVVVDSFTTIPLDDQMYDTVSIVASLNYFEEPVAVLKESHRLLKDDGQIILTMPNNTIMKIWHKFRESWAHASGYSDAEMQDLLGQSGFKLEKKSTFLFGVNNLYVFKKQAA